MQLWTAYLTSSSREPGSCGAALLISSKSAATVNRRLDVSVEVSTLVNPLLRKRSWLNISCCLLYAAGAGQRVVKGGCHGWVCRATANAPGWRQLAGQSLQGVLAHCRLCLS